MSITVVRLVGGESAGQEVSHNVDASPVIKMAVHPDFNTCRECVPGTSVPLDPSKMVFHQEEYLIHKMNFGSGHFHYYAAPSKWRLVDLMNHMWDGFKIEADKNRRDGH